MRYRFGNCEIRIDTHELLVDGRAAAIEPQVFELIRFLAENAERLVTHEELIDAVWGGRIVSDSAVSARISAARAALGDSGSRQDIIRTVPRRGFRFLPRVEPQDAAPQPPVAETHPRQSIRFCRSSDGHEIAYAATGSGRPLVRAGHWLTHLEHDWRSPVWRPFLDEMGRSFSLVRYDQRGNGLSDWKLKSFSLESCVADLEAVADAAGLDRFTLFGTSQGAPIAVAYAARHPERVERLILLGGYARGRLARESLAEREEGEAIITLIRHGWGKPGSQFIRAFSSMFIPDATPEQISSLTELQRLTTSAENAVTIRTAVDRFDVSDLLERVVTPTLVMHARNDSIQPLAQGRELALGIRGAEFVMFEGDNHVILPHEPAWKEFFEAIRRFALEGTVS